jgi:hypothetical protein
MKTFVLVFFTFICHLACSQINSFSREWAFGVNGGVNLSKMRFNSGLYIPQGLYVQPSGGLTVRYISENHFGILGELNYSLCGWTEKKDTMNNVHLNEYTRSLAYFEIPLMTHLYFNLGKNTRLIFNAGPQFRYNIGDKVKKISIVDPENEPSYYDENDERSKIYNKFDYGLKGAMGIEIRTGIGSFILSGSYYFGLADVFNSARSQPFQASSNQIIGVNLTYLTRMRKGE